MTSRPNKPFRYRDPAFWHSRDTLNEQVAVLFVTTCLFIIVVLVLAGLLAQLIP